MSPEGVEAARPASVHRALTRREQGSRPVKVMAELKSVKVTSATIKATFKLDEVEAAKLLDPAKVNDLTQMLDLKALPQPDDLTHAEEVDDYIRRHENGVDQQIDFNKDRPQI